MATEKDRVPLSSEASQAPMAAGAVFLSYASDDAAAAERIATALRNAGVEVWFDKHELRGGDAWDRQIREQIHHCRLFIPVISANSERRDEGYFRREWSLAADRTRDMAHKRAFLVPVVIDGTSERGASVPEKFHELQWTRLPGGETPPAFVERIMRLLSPELSPLSAVSGAAPGLREPVRATSRSKPVLLAIVALVVFAALAYFVADKFWLSKRAASSPASATVTNGATSLAIPEKSIAVLPFIDLSEKHDQEYFADGLAEELIDVLATVPGLRVIGRTSSFQFKNRNEDLRDIGSRLGVAHLVEGSVRRSGEHIRVTTQLIRTSDAAHEWSETFDRNTSDVLQLQSQMASALGRALQLSVTESSSSLRTRSAEAQDIYFRGMHALDRYTPQGCEEAANDFQRAIQLDPQFVRAYEMLGFAHYLQAANAFVPADSGYEAVREDAVRILKFNNRSSLAHSLLVWVNTLYTWDWAAAQRESAVALAVGPHDWFALQSAGDLALSLGQLDRAEQQLRAALVMDPLSADSVFDLSQVLQGRGRLPEAETEARRGLAINPAFAYGHFMLGNVLLAQGRFEEAPKAYEQEIPEGAKYPGLAKAYHATRRITESKSALDQAIREYGDSQAFDIALTYAYLGDSDRTFEWLDRALRQKDIEFQYLRSFWELRLLRDDPRYKALLRKMNLPE